MRYVEIRPGSVRPPTRHYDGSHWLSVSWPATRIRENYNSASSNMTREQAAYDTPQGRKSMYPLEYDVENDCYLKRHVPEIFYHLDPVQYFWTKQDIAELVFFTHGTTIETLGFEVVTVSHIPQQQVKINPLTLTPVVVDAEFN